MVKRGKSSVLKKAQAKRRALTKAGKHVSFQSRANAIQKEGYSAKSANAIAASIAQKTYGKRGLQALAKAGRKAKSK